MKGPLEGIKVLDMGRFIAGPYCALLLGDMGAEVLKIETVKGDDGRRMLPAVGDMSTYFIASNKNKGDITLNLRSEKGKEILWKLLKDVDVLVEYFRPGVMDDMGFGWEVLLPGQNLSPFPPANINAVVFIILPFSKVRFLHLPSIADLRRKMNR